MIRLPSTTTLAFILLAAAAAPESAAQQGEACAYAQRAHSVGFEGCFRRTLLSCSTHNDWQQRGVCASASFPGGPTFPPGSFEGALCTAAGAGYSPGAEACLGGVYQQCDRTGQWRSVTPPSGHPGC